MKTGFVLYWRSGAGKSWKQTTQNEPKFQDKFTSGLRPADLFKIIWKSFFLLFYQL
jgi:hypothetical protein